MKYRNSVPFGFSNNVDCELYTFLQCKTGKATILLHSCNRSSTLSTVSLPVTENPGRRYLCSAVHGDLVVLVSFSGYVCLIKLYTQLSSPR